MKQDIMGTSDCFHHLYRNIVDHIHLQSQSKHGGIKAMRGNLLAPATQL